MTEQPILAWHFLASDANGKPILRDGTPAEVGKVYIVDPPLKLCKRGLHASKRAIDAIQYSPGAWVCRVECSGEIVTGSDKLWCSRRKIVWMADATRELHLFACDIAEKALKKYGGKVDPRSTKAIEVKRLWVDGKATDAELDAARDAAWVAARDVARYAAWSEAWVAAWVAARDVARYAAWDVGEATDVQNEKLEAALMALCPK